MAKGYKIRPKDWAPPVVCVECGSVETVKVKRTPWEKFLCFVTSEREAHSKYICQECYAVMLKGNESIITGKHLPVSGMRA
jgi:hypothetical protein